MATALLVDLRVNTENIHGQIQPLEPGDAGLRYEAGGWRAEPYTDKDIAATSPRGQKDGFLLLRDPREVSSREGDDRRVGGSAQSRKPPPPGSGGVDETPGVALVDSRRGGH